MEEIIEFQDQFYVLATSSRMDEHNRVLKHGDTFAVFDRYGNVQRIGLGEQGLYHGGTRRLSRFELRIMGRRPLLLSSTVNQDNAVLAVDLTNPDVLSDGELVLSRNQLHVSRRAFLWKGACYERIWVRNFQFEPVEFSLALIFDADFADIFEVRGLKRERRGKLLEPIVGADSVELRYRGLDDEVRRTTLLFSPAPEHLAGGRADFQDTIPAHGEKSYFVTICCEPPSGSDRPSGYDEASAEAAEALRRCRSGDARISTSNEQFNEWLERSGVDLHLMVTRTDQGPYPYAGVPWFSTAFGRDGIWTALEFLWVNPALARGVLSYLAAYQAREVNPLQDAEPGKILHETRDGEMAALGEIPFGRYYGSVDSTPLFVMLAGAYFQRTADLDFIASLWPNVEAALRWIDEYGDVDGDGLVEYTRQSPNGLVVQGWKDSVDSVFHADGSLPDGPIALCEVQGYVYAARRAAAELAGALGHSERGEKLAQQAEELRRLFEERFWCEDLSTYALALDGDKAPCKVRTSNPGHCLYTGIADPSRAERVAETLMSAVMFSGWGIRTVAAGEARYNPMSYHNGSIWPHDNVILAAGLRRYGLRQHVLRILSGLFDASMLVDLHRMPELFCGFSRREGQGPTLYPLACAPQSWDAAAVFSVLQSALGLVIDAPHRQVRFVRPALPESLQRVWISGLRVGEASVDLLLERFPSDVSIQLLRRSGDMEIVTVK